MSSRRTFRALAIHTLKVWALAMLGMIPFWLIAPHIPRWLFVALFSAFGLFVFLPAVFGVGPIGRLVGKQLNDAAIEDARAEREDL